MAAYCGIISEYVLKDIIIKGLAPQHIINRCQSTIEKTKQLQTFVEWQIPQAAGRVRQLNRTVYDAPNSRNECYVGLGKSYDFYFNYFQLNSINNKGMKPDGFVHAGDLCNAFFAGQEFVFGDRDGLTFNGLTDELDVIGHELSHGVSDALNESISDASISDALGIMVKQWGPWKNDAQVWEDRQPAHWEDFKESPLSDGLGGVHINSGIHNCAFFLAATYRALSSGKLRIDGKAKFKEFAVS
ncbi:hypothetical protein BJY01DRAFT_239429 [Aspergillus pseudoustus]|uniref:Peptidase M4 domain-containing protein n=1 Tax=Aspergillus pseudoustus TaxID=1810923 RepID=A0ABR4J0Q7_9EURO